MILSELLTDVKTAWATTVATLGTGTATIVEWIPDGIGKLGTLVGIALSIVLIYTHVRGAFTSHRKSKLDIEKATLEIDALKREARRSE
jgi:hypothetical protein